MRAFVVTGPRPGRGRARSSARSPATRRRSWSTSQRAGRVRHRRRVLHRRDGLPAPGARGAIRCGSGHEWCGTVPRSGDGVDRAWLGRRVTGDTMLGCGALPSLPRGQHHVCADRFEIGIRGGFPARWPSSSPSPPRRCWTCPTRSMTAAGAMVEPGRQRAAGGRRRRRCAAGDRVARARDRHDRAARRDVRPGRRRRGALLGSAGSRSASPRALGFTAPGPGRPAGAALGRRHRRVQRSELPALALDLVEPGQAGRLRRAGRRPSLVDTRALALKDVTAVGILGGIARAGRRRSSTIRRRSTSIRGRWSRPPWGSTRRATCSPERPAGAGPARRSTSTRDGAAHELAAECLASRPAVAGVPAGAAVSSAARPPAQRVSPRSRSARMSSATPEDDDEELQQYAVMAVTTRQNSGARTRSVRKPSPVLAWNARAMQRERGQAREDHDQRVEEPRPPWA